MTFWMDPHPCLFFTKVIDAWQGDVDASGMYLPAGGAILAAYAITAAAVDGSSFASVTEMAYLASGLACLGAIGGLASQKTAALGNKLGMIGVSLGITATLGLIASGGETQPETYLQMLAVMLAGGAAGAGIAKVSCLSFCHSTLHGSVFLFGALHGRSLH